MSDESDPLKGGGLNHTLARARVVSLTMEALGPNWKRPGSSWPTGCTTLWSKPPLSLPLRRIR